MSSFYKFAFYRSTLRNPRFDCLCFASLRGRRLKGGRGGGEGGGGYRYRYVYLESYTSTSTISK